MIDQTASFWDYLIYYPEEDEDDFDGIHYGGIKGIRDDAPAMAKKEFARFQEERERAAAHSIKI